MTRFDPRTAQALPGCGWNRKADGESGCLAHRWIRTPTCGAWWSGRGYGIRDFDLGQGSLRWIQSGDGVHRHP